MPITKSKQLTTSIETFEPKRLTVTDFKENERSKQKMAWLRYNHPALGEDTTLMLQTPWITLTSGGIPRFNPDYHKNDRDRAFMRLPMVEGTEFFKKMTKLDSQFTSDEFKKEKFGKYWKKFTMYPQVRIPEDDPDDDRDPLPPSMKLKFDLAWNEEDADACDIKTQVFLSKTDENGKRERTPAKSGTIADMEQLVRLGSKLRLIIRPVKVWYSAKKEYGVTWKIMKMEVEPSSSGNALMKAFYEADAFLDSDDEEEEVAVPATGGGKADADSDDEEDEDDEEDDDEDDEDDDEDDSPVVPVKRSSKRSKGKSRGKQL